MDVRRSARQLMRLVARSRSAVVVRFLTVAMCIAAIVGSATIAIAGSEVPRLKTTAVLSGEAVGDESGYQVEIADLDGDGIDDLVIGAWLHAGGAPESGAVYIEYGPVTKSINLKSADVKLFTPAAGDYVGEGPLGVADMNGDGASELVLGAPGSFYAAQPGSPGKMGEAFLLYGGKRLRGALQLPKVADARFTGIHMTEWLGFGSSGVGDLDDDGYEEMLVGAPATAGFTGAAYLFYGSPERLEGDVSVTSADATFVGNQPGGMFGYEAAAGDTDADKDDDLFIASKPLVGGPASVVMFPGGERFSGANLAASAAWRTNIGSVDYFTGPTVASGQDLTGDRIDDLVIGLGGGYYNPLTVAITWVVRGSKEGLAESGLQGPVGTSIAGTGASVAIGDVNRDGWADLISGAPYPNPSAHVFFGPLVNDVMTLGEAGAVFQGKADSGAGSAVAVGNLDKDRAAEIAVGAPSGAGATYVVSAR